MHDPQQRQLNSAGHHGEECHADDMLAEMAAAFFYVSQALAPLCCFQSKQAPKTQVAQFLDSRSRECYYPTIASPIPSRQRVWVTICKAGCWARPASKKVWCFTHRAVAPARLHCCARNENSGNSNARGKYLLGCMVASAPSSAQCGNEAECGAQRGCAAAACRLPGCCTAGRRRPARQRHSGDGGQPGFWRRGRPQPLPPWPRRASRAGDRDPAQPELRRHHRQHCFSRL